jgi:hypothetical protein
MTWSNPWARRNQLWPDPVATVDRLPKTDVEIVAFAKFTHRGDSAAEIHLRVSPSPFQDDIFGVSHLLFVIARPLSEPEVVMRIDEARH